MHREVNLSDVHAPYHDVAAWSLALEVVQRIRPAVVNILGDFWDFRELMRFDHRQGIGGLQAGINSGFDLLKELKAVHKRKIRFVPGNHELRLQKYLLKNQQLFGLDVLNLPILLRLEELGVEYLDYEIEIVPDKLVGRHGGIIRAKSGWSALTHLMRDGYSISSITGDTHRLAKVYFSSRGKTVLGVENGCLCDMNVEYVHNPNWQHGLSIVHVLDEDFDVDVVRFLRSGRSSRAIVLGEQPISVESMFDEDEDID